MGTPRTLDTNWTKVLADVEHVLAQAIAKIDERDAQLAATLPASAVPVVDSGAIASRIANLEAGSARAEKNAAELDRMLQDGEDALRAWLTRAEAIRRQLATLAGRAVG
jgi:hypothetical protein